MDALKGSAKALVAALIGAGATWLAQRYGVSVPDEARNALVEIIVALIAGAATGSLTWLIPNKPA